MNAFKLNALLVALVALFAVASASRNLLQSTIPGTSIPTFPGFEAATQYFNPQAIQQFYQQAVPYDIYANWVNRNTAFNLPLVTGLPGLPPSGST
ncbi:hypothetical protein HKI87_10g62390 [Chloropicon roscoffensis]|uniref:Uncharacterized protein n=1 Tax=Chloropicon roscoffensis TaxID=1461544 RepID=A0AAX4PF96_9CHLO